MATRDYTAAILRHAARNGIPPALLAATVETESTGNPRAYRGEPQLQDGSHGLVQILLKTARGLGYKGEVGSRDALTGLYDVETNLSLGAKLLADLWRKFPAEPDRVASAYNGGDRPTLGFGTRLTRPVTLCLARDQRTGTCIKSVTAQPGTFGNQEHVTRFMRHYATFSREFGSGSTATGGTAVTVPAPWKAPGTAAGNMDGKQIAAIAGLGGLLSLLLR